MLPDADEACNVMQAAILPLLALIVGFTFPMAISRSTSARTMKKRRPTRLVPKPGAPIFYLPSTCRDPDMQLAGRTGVIIRVESIHADPSR